MASSCQHVVSVYLHSAKLILQAGQKRPERVLLFRSGDRASDVDAQKVVCQFVRVARGTVANCHRLAATCVKGFDHALLLFLVARRQFVENVHSVFFVICSNVIDRGLLGLQVVEQFLRGCNVSGQSSEDMTASK
jgi:hypothetical protein